jgi:hypothetical protein
MEYADERIETSSEASIFTFCVSVCFWKHEIENIRITLQKNCELSDRIEN